MELSSPVAAQKAVKDEMEGSKKRGTWFDHDVRDHDDVRKEVLSLRRLPTEG
jgi:hypothetical protein